MLTSPITHKILVSLSLFSYVVTVQIGVRQFLAQHDPDVDAIYRLTSTVPFDFRLFYFYF
jgi:hypothetical protein